MVYRHAVFMALQDNINNVDFNARSYKEVIDVASNIEFMALTLRRMYEHIAVAIGHLYLRDKELPYQADKIIKKIKKQIKEPEGESSIKLKAADVRNAQKQGVTKQSSASWLISTDHVKEGEFITLEDIEKGYGRLGGLLHVPTKHQPEYWKEKDILDKMSHKVFALFQGHVLYKNDIAQVMGCWHGNENVFSVSALEKTE